MLQLQNENEIRNSFYRAPKVSPKYEYKTDRVIIKTIDLEVTIEKIEETILYIIADFKFAPYWLIQQWFEREHKDTYEIVSNWIKVGLVWLESSSMGIFIRPTNYLLNMFYIENQSYISIPFGLLNHTCGEEELVFEVMQGYDNSELWQVIKSFSNNFLPPFHPLDLQIKNDTGTTIIREANFRHNRYDINALIKNEQELENEIKLEKAITSEFNDFTRFPIVNIQGEKFTTQTPDVLIPVPRENGKAQSIAIEIELSAKTPQKYDGIMKNYKDNNKFGTVFYLCGNKRIESMVREAYKRNNGLGTCKLYTMMFTPPAMKLSNFSNIDRQHAGNLLLLSSKVE